jgi:hypothetical protein
MEEVMADERRRIAKSDRVLGLSKICSDCGNRIESNGELLYSPDMGWWSIGYWCPYDREVMWSHSRDTAALIDEITKNIDIESLPFEPFHKYD